MPVYRATIIGRKKPLFIKADSAAKGAADLVTLEALTTRELADFIGGSEVIYKPGEPLPADDVEPEPEPEAEKAEAGDKE